MKSKGALIFARNNAQIDYIKQAHYSAKRIKKFLNIPTSIVTDSVDYLKETYKDFDGSGVAKHLQFKNDLRTQSYELTPYDETLLLDSDYIIANSLFKHCFEQDHDF